MDVDNEGSGRLDPMGIDFGAYALGISCSALQQTPTTSDLGSTRGSKSVIQRR